MNDSDGVDGDLRVMSSSRNSPKDHERGHHLASILGSIENIGARGFGPLAPQFSSQSPGLTGQVSKLGAVKGIAGEKYSTNGSSAYVSSALTVWVKSPKLTDAAITNASNRAIALPMALFIVITFILLLLSLFQLFANTIVRDYAQLKPYRNPMKNATIRLNILNKCAFEGILCAI